MVNYPTYYFLKHYLSTAQHKHGNNHDEYMLYVAHSNSAPHLFSFFYHTNNGIVHASTNLANEIYEIVRKQGSHRSINKITFIGSSIGGNYIRYTAHLLQHSESYLIDNAPFFERVKPRKLISLAAPHLGIRDWMQPSQQLIDFLVKYSPSQTLNELLHLDEERIVETMNEQHSVFEIFDKVLIFFNSGWDSLVTCPSSCIDQDGSYCEITQTHCNANQQQVFDESVFHSLHSNQTSSVYRVPMCLKANAMQTLMAHAILATALPPVSQTIAEFVTSN